MFGLLLLLPEVLLEEVKCLSSKERKWVNIVLHYFIYCQFTLMEKEVLWTCSRFFTWVEGGKKLCEKRAFFDLIVCTKKLSWFLLCWNSNRCGVFCQSACDWRVFAPKRATDDTYSFYNYFIAGRSSKHTYTNIFHRVAYFLATGPILDTSR